MTRIPDALTQCVVYLYPNEEAAVAGAATGGCGFLTTTEDNRVFVVTNMHVAHECPIVRLQSTSIDAALMRVEPQWYGTGESDDVAVAELDWSARPPNSIPHSGLDWKAFHLRHDEIGELDIGIGDDIYMLGRSAVHSNPNFLATVARFGNIAADRLAGPVLDAGERWVDAYLVEMRSLSGSSGSPVFLEVQFGLYPTPADVRTRHANVIRLLGIDVGHKNLFSTVLRADSNQKADVNFRVQENSGLSIVAPADRIDYAITYALAAGDEGRLSG